MEAWQPCLSFSPIRTMTPDEVEQLKGDLKDAIFEKYEAEGRLSLLDERILDDEEEKKSLLDDSDIHDLLDTYVITKGGVPRRGTVNSDEDEHLLEELEDVLREMTMESEGIVV